MEILCFLHALEGADSEKVVFEHWPVCHSVCLSKTTLQLKRKEPRTSNLVHEFIVPVGRHNKVFEKIAHGQRVAATELYGFKGIAKKRKELRTSNLVHEFLPVGTEYLSEVIKIRILNSCTNL